MHEGELQEGSLGHQFFGFRLVGLGQAGQLDHDLVGPQRADVRLGDTDGVHAPAQHLHGLGEGATGGSVLQLVGVHRHEERRAAFQVQPKLNLPGHLFLEFLQDKPVVRHLAAKCHFWEIVIGQHQAGCLHSLVERAELIAVFVLRVKVRLGGGVNLVELRVLVCGFAKLLDQFSGLILGRPHLESGPGHDEQQ